MTACMQWTKDIDIEKHLEGDLQLIYEHCGEDVLLALLDRLKGMQFYLRAEPVRAMKKAYVRERSGELTVKEIAVRLEVSQEFVYDTLRSEEKPPTLFDEKSTPDDERNDQRRDQ